MDILTKLGINSTFFVQLINFLILVFLLYKILYKPLFKTINERTERIKKGLDLTEKMEEEYKKIEDTRNEVVIKAQTEATKIITSAEEKAEIRAQKIIEETKKKGDEMIKDYQKSLEKEKEQLNEQINTKVYDSVKVVLKKILKSDKELDKQFVNSIIEKE